MKSKKTQQPGAAVRPEKSARDSGLGAVAVAGEKRGTVASQTKTTRRLDRAVKREADNQMACKEKAVERWEGEGGAIPPAKKGGQR